MVLWRLTEKGKDTLPILMQMVAFSSKWYTDLIFEDNRPRKFSDLSSPKARECDYELHLIELVVYLLAKCILI